MSWFLHTWASLIKLFGLVIMAVTCNAACFFQETFSILSTWQPFNYKIDFYYMDCRAFKLYLYYADNHCHHGGRIVQYLADLLLDPTALGLISSIPEFFSEEKIVNVAEINQRCCLDESGQWYENFDWTDLVLPSGKLVLKWISSPPS